ncbi:MAG TPA: hypothetical protein ENJ33_05825 [Thiothrix sp.]|nr:hypothetical protein [Thiothrix sp.]
MNTKQYNILLITLLISTTYTGLANADWKESLRDMWGSTEEIREKTVDKTKEYSNKAVETSKKYYHSIAENYNSLAEGKTKHISPQIIKEENTQHLKAVWSDVLQNLDHALDINMQIDQAPESRWFGDDKQSLREDQIDVFADIEILLDSPTISANRQHIDKLKQKITEERQDIAQLKEQRVVASGIEKEKLNKKIQQAKHKITDYTNTIAQEKTNLKLRLQEMGLLLSEQQVDVLLSRVDSDDIIKMSIIYDVLTDITNQLMELTQESNEDINQARKYYGMHVILLKLVMNIQQSYINQLSNSYLPKINTIREETAQLSQVSKKLLNTTQKQSSRILLQKNIKAQQLTLKVANIYAQQLIIQQAKVQKALNLIRHDYRVAKNTYDTVKLSADLVRLMKTNQASFHALMNIQIPEIVPFENREMQKKFEELSILLKH